MPMPTPASMRAPNPMINASAVEFVAASTRVAEAERMRAVLHHPVAACRRRASHTAAAPVATTSPANTSSRTMAGAVDEGDAAGRARTGAAFSNT